MPAVRFRRLRLPRRAPLTTIRQQWNRLSETTVRRLLRLDVLRDGDLLTLAVQADAFCHSMVRALVGGLIAVGEDRRPVDWPAQVLAGRQRDPGGRVVPAHGLTLVEVTYPPESDLAARALETRRLRV